MLPFNGVQAFLKVFAALAFLPEFFLNGFCVFDRLRARAARFLLEGFQFLGERFCAFAEQGGSQLAQTLEIGQCAFTGAGEEETHAVRQGAHDRRVAGGQQRDQWAYPTEECAARSRSFAGLQRA